MVVVLVVLVDVGGTRVVGTIAGRVVGTTAGRVVGETVEPERAGPVVVVVRDACR